MKKLLNLLSVLTITGTTMPNVIAASNYEKQEIQSELVLLSTDNKNNKFFRKNSTREVFKLNDGTDTPTKINGTGNDFIGEILFDKENNAYFIYVDETTSNGGIFKLNDGTDTVIKIKTNIENSNNYIYYTYFDKNNNLFFKTVISEVYKLPNNSDTAFKIKNIPYIYKEYFDNKNNTFLLGIQGEVFKLNDGTDTPTKINGTGNDFIGEILFDKENNAYFRVGGIIAYKLNDGTDTAYLLPGQIPL